MADIVRYVNTASTAGGDGTTNATAGANRAYPTLASWNTAEATNLVTPGDTHTVYCTGGADTAYVLMSGWTVSATSYVRIHVLQADRHNGTAGTGYRVTHASGIDVYQNYVRIEGLALRKLLIGSSSGASSDVRIDGCLIEGTTGIGLSWDGGIGTLKNTIIQNTSGDGLFIQNNQSPPTLVMANCTIGGCGGYGVNRASGTATAKSCYAGGNTTADWNGTITRTKCGSSDATGTTGLTSIAYSTANFTNVTAGSQNLHIVAGSALINAGDGPSADADITTTDIDGHTRSGTIADLGADEIPVAATGSFLFQPRPMAALLVR